MSANSDQPKKNNTGLILLLGIGFMVLFVFILEIEKSGSYFSATTPSKSIVDDPISTKKDSINKIEAEKEAKILQEEKAKNEAEFNVLKKKFTFKKDEFNGNGWYTHKTFVNSNYRKTLKAYVRDNGYIYLESQWYDEDWIFHTHIQVKAGENVVTTNTIESYDEHNVHQNDGGVVWENISYVNGGDNGVIDAITKADKAVKVRFVGQKFHRDIVLPTKDQVAIKESQKLAELIKSL